MYVCVDGVGWVKHTCNYESTREERDINVTGDWPKEKIDLLGTLSDSLSNKNRH